MATVRLMDVIWDWCERSGAALGWNMYRSPNISLRYSTFRSSIVMSYYSNALELPVSVKSALV